MDWYDSSLFVALADEAQAIRAKRRGSNNVVCTKGRNKMHQLLQCSGSTECLPLSNASKALCSQLPQVNLGHTSSGVRFRSAEHEPTESFTKKARCFPEERIRERDLCAEGRSDRL